MGNDMQQRCLTGFKLFMLQLKPVGQQDDSQFLYSGLMIFSVNKYITFQTSNPLPGCACSLSSIEIPKKLLLDFVLLTLY